MFKVVRLDWFVFVGTVSCGCPSEVCFGCGQRQEI